MTASDGSATGPTNDASASPGPARVLDGLRVVDLTMNYAGPYATMVLGDFGADVIKIEPPGRGDSTRTWMPIVEGRSASFGSVNRGKRSLALDLRTPEGRAIAQRLIADADVFVQSLRPGVTDDLGLGWDDLRRSNPRLVYADVSAFGDVGPRAGEPGYDAILQAYTGLIELTGHPDADPVRIGTGIIDFATGLWTATAVIAALHERERTGQGTRIDVTMLGAALSFAMHHLCSVMLTGDAPQRLGTAQHNAAPYEAVRTGDGLVMVAAGNDGLFGRLCDAIDDGRLRDDPRFASNQERVANRDALVATMEQLIGTSDPDWLVETLRQHGVPASRIRSIAELPDDPQVNALGLFGETDGGRYPLLPVSLGAERPAPRHGPPALGEHSREVLNELGMASAEIDALYEQGVVTSG